ncbi:MAG: helix-turn-helix domain-containing protein [Bacilli bacterium]|jgi:excisionase family DNA binding protein
MEQFYLLKDTDLQKIMKQAVFEAVGEIREPIKVEAETPERLYTTEEVCEILRCSKPTLHRWKRDGLIPFVRIGTNIRYKESDLKKLLETKGKGGDYDK